MSALSLHIPAEPVGEATGWQDQIAQGVPFASVLTGPGSIAGWLFDRWKSVETLGIDRVAFDAMVCDAGRELWLWLRGERQWDAAIASLLGRISRRMPHGS